MSHIVSFQEQCRMNDEITVYGYVRNNKCHNDIPVDIINLCVKYYHMNTDQFDSEHIGHCHELSADGATITHTTQSHDWSTTILKNVISDGIYEWKFKVIKTGAIMVGICRDDKSNLVKNSFFTDIGQGYGVMVTDGYKYRLTSRACMHGKAGFVCKENDIITMRLDLTQLTISYCLNDENPIIEFKDINKAIYRAAVYTYWQDSCVTVPE